MIEAQGGPLDKSPMNSRRELCIVQQFLVLFYVICFTSLLFILSLIVIMKSLPNIMELYNKSALFVVVRIAHA